MIVICEECGKKYRIDPSRIKGEKLKVKCKSCNHVFVISKDEYAIKEKNSQDVQSVAPEQTEAGEKKPEAEPEHKPMEKRTPVVSLARKRRLGVRGKMVILFMIVPIILMIGAGIFYMKQLNDLSGYITAESSKIVTQMAERIVQEKARSVAAQVQLFLLGHPTLKKEEFNKNEDFKKIAIQKVGETGYSALYELPGVDGVWRTWAHPNQKIIGIDMGKLKEPLGKSFPGFWKVFTGVRGGKESKGYYQWQDKEGKIRSKFMVCTPVTGTRYVVAATTYMDEFTKPIKNLETKATIVTKKVRNISFAILGATILLIGLIVSIYGHRLTGKIRSITDLAERISVGDLDAELTIKSKDEIGDLAEAITRMQESIRLSIERLRRRRG